MVCHMSPQTPVPEANYSPRWVGDTRTRPPRVGDERELLTSYLDYYRATIELKCAGVPVENSNLARFR